MIPDELYSAIQIRPKTRPGWLFEKNDLPVISRAIKFMKDRYHIGIEEAYIMVIDMQELRWGTHDLSDEVNRVLGSSAVYKATPERVWGLGKALEYAASEGRKKFLETHQYEIENYKEKPPVHDWLFHTSLVENELFNIDRSDKPCSFPFAYRNRVPLIFKSANDSGVASDEEFARFVLMQAGNKAKLFLQDFSRNPDQNRRFYGADGLINSYVNSLMSSLVDTDISRYFDNRKLDSYVSSEILRKMDDVDCDFLIDRIRRDKLDKQMHYRRMIVQSFLSKNSFGSVDEVFNAVEEDIRNQKFSVDYWTAAKNNGVIDVSLKGQNVRLKFDGNAENRAKECEKAEKLLDRSQFLLNLLRMEHHFVESFLG